MPQTKLPPDANRERTWKLTVSRSRSWLVYAHTLQEAHMLADVDQPPPTATFLERVTLHEVTRQD